MGKKAPSAPDPVATAQAQASANKDAAISQANINMVNQKTPYGSLDYTQRGTASDGTPQYTATQTLSPEQQRILDLTNQAGIKFGETANTQLGSVSDRLSTPLDFSTLGAAPVANEQTRQATADAMYQRLNPQMDRERAALETRLANQGITMGSDAWKKGMDDFSRSQNDQRLAIDSQAGNEMARMYGLESTARDKAINEMVQQRQIPLNELAAMLSGSQVQGPSFVNAPQENIAPADTMGATYANYNAQNAANTANNQGLYGLLGTGLMAGASYFGGGAAKGATSAMGWSDRRLKTGIRAIGKLANGLTVYAFRYIWGGPEVVGLMAQDVLKSNPQAVLKHESGYLMVNYTEAVR